MNDGALSVEYFVVYSVQEGGTMSKIARGAERKKGHAVQRVEGDV